MNQLSCVVQNSRQHGGPREPRKSGGADGHPPPPTWDHSELAYLLGWQASLLLIKGLCGYKKSMKTIQLDSGIRGPTSSDLKVVLPKEDFRPHLLPTSLAPSLPEHPSLCHLHPSSLSGSLPPLHSPNSARSPTGQATAWRGEPGGWLLTPSVVLLVAACLGR